MKTTIIAALISISWPAAAELKHSDTGSRELAPAPRRSCPDIVQDRNLKLASVIPKLAHDSPAPTKMVGILAFESLGTLDPNSSGYWSTAAPGTALRSAAAPAQGKVFFPGSSFARMVFQRAKPGEGDGGGQWDELNAKNAVLIPDLGGQPFALAEIDLNKNSGGLAIYADSVRRLDRGEYFPPDINAILKRIGACEESERKSSAEQWRARLKTTQEIVFGDKPATGPQSNHSFTYPIWNEKDKTLRVVVIHESTNGRWTLYREGVPGPNGRGGSFNTTRFGEEFGIRQFTVYEVGADGELRAITKSDLTGFRRQLPVKNRNADLETPVR